MKSRWIGRLAFCIAAMAIVLVSCASGADEAGVLTTANNVKINLADDEKKMELNQVDKFVYKKYDKYYNSIKDHQVPLNKVFANRTCRFYYGIPLSGSVKELYDAYIKKYGDSVIDKNMASDMMSRSIFAKDSGNFFIISVIKTQKNSLLVGGVIGSDSAQIMQYFQENNLRTRIQDEK